MSRGRRWVKEKKKKLRESVSKVTQVKEMTKAKIGQKIIDKANLSADQLKALDKGYNAYMDILDKKKELKRQLKGADSVSRATLNDKIRLLDSILRAFTRQNSAKIKELAAEYNEKYPGEFDD